MTRHERQLLSRDSEMIGRMNVTWWIRSWFNFVPLTKLLTLDIYCFCFVLCSDSTVSFVIQENSSERKNVFSSSLKKMRSVGWFVFFNNFFLFFPCSKLIFISMELKVENEIVFVTLHTYIRGTLQSKQFISVHLINTYDTMVIFFFIIHYDLILMNIFSSLHFYQ